MLNDSVISYISVYDILYLVRKHLLIYMQWAERRRLEIAGLMCSVLRAHLKAYDPTFSLTLRYLIRYTQHDL